VQVTRRLILQKARHQATEPKFGNTL
jgi:hypothetical protein